VLAPFLMALSPVPNAKLVVVLMMGSVKLLEMVTEMAIAPAAKSVQLLRAKPVVQHRHRAVALVAPTQKAPALTVTVREIAAALKVAAAIAVPDLHHGVMHLEAIVVRNTAARGAKLF